MVQRDCDQKYVTLSHPSPRALTSPLPYVVLQSEPIISSLSMSALSCRIIVERCIALKLMRHTEEGIQGPEEMVEWGKCLLCKREDLSSDP